MHVADHPLVAHKLTTLRDERTDSPTFRRLADELVTLLAYEATRGIRVATVAVVTPVAPTTGIKLADPRPLVVPILRAGLGMLDGMMRLLPTAEVGFLGMIRDEETLRVSTYADRVSPTTCPAGRCSCSTRCSPPAARWSPRSTCCSAAAPPTSRRSACWPRPEGVQRLRAAFDDSQVQVTVVTAGLDERLNEQGLHRPGTRGRGRPALRHRLTPHPHVDTEVSGGEARRSARAASASRRTRTTAAAARGTARG